MCFVLLESSEVLGFVYGLFTGTVSALIISRFLEPLYDSYVDSMKNNTGRIGRYYNKYTKTFGRIYFLKKTTRTKPLKKIGYEYKLYNIDNKVEGYMSEIIRLDENRFKRIQGEIKRVTSPNKSFTSYFKGFIKNKEKDFLIWEESYKNEKGHFHLTTHFKIPKNEEKDIPGITIEEKDGKIVNCFTVLSFTGTPYTSLQRLLKNKDFYSLYTLPLNIRFENIEGNQNKFITNY